MRGVAEVVAGDVLFLGRRKVDQPPVEQSPTTAAEDVSPDEIPF